MISEEKKTKITNHLNSKIPNYRCPCCNQQKFQQEPSIYIELVEGAIEKMVQGQDFGYARKVAVHCSNCGYLTYFRAEIIGV